MGAMDYSKVADLYDLYAQTDGVHYTEQNALPDMIEAMALTRTRRGLGIDDAACAVFDHGQFAGALGQSLYEVEMQDFGQRLYTCTERALT